MKANVSAETVIITCPRKKCGEPIPEPRSGSHAWAISDIHGGETITCPTCGATLEIPTRARLELLGA